MRQFIRFTTRTGRASLATLLVLGVLFLATEAAQQHLAASQSAFNKTALNKTERSNKKTSSIKKAQSAKKSSAKKTESTPKKTKRDRPKKERLPKEKNNTSNKPRKKEAVPLTATCEAAAIDFAKQNHPELVQLLIKLKKQNQKAYQRALRQLNKTTERFEKVKQHVSPKRFETELNTWKLDSRIRLLVAKASITPEGYSDVESRLNELLKKRIGMRAQQLQLEKERLLHRQKKIDKLLTAFQENPEKVQQQELNRIRRELGLTKKQLQKRPKKTKKTTAENRSSPLGK